MRLIEQTPELDHDFISPSPEVRGVELEGRQDVFVLLTRLQTLATRTALYNSFDSEGDLSFIGSDFDEATQAQEAGRLAFVLADEMSKVSGEIGPLSFRGSSDGLSGTTLRSAVLVTDTEVEQSKTRDYLARLFSVNGSRPMVDHKDSRQLTVFDGESDIV